MSNSILKVILENILELPIFFFVLVVFTAVAFTACNKVPQATTTKGNNIKVELLFEQDSVKVYRFYDGGYYHYFTTRGETMSTKTAGKTTYQENIR
jgi:hypothetical protein